jgi:hypothetical protein
MTERLAAALASVWLDAREDDERDDWGMAWARAISLAARADWVAMRRVAFAAGMSLVAAWDAWYPAVTILAWIHMYLSAVFKWALKFTQSLVVLVVSNWHHSLHVRSYRPVFVTIS